MHIYEEDVQWLVTCIFRSYGTIGIDAQYFQSSIIRFGKAFTNLREEMMEWVDWLNNDSPPWAAYQGVMLGRLVALDKLPRVRTMGINEFSLSLLANIIMRDRGYQDKYTV